MLIDTHCHLNFENFDKDRSEVLIRARDAGVVQFLNPAVDLKTSREGIALAEAHDEVYAAIGVHPNEALSWNNGALEELRELIHHPKVVAIGEIGLDYYRDRAPRNLQRQVFQEQLDLAAEANLPVVIHMRNTSDEDRRAAADMLDILTAWQRQLELKASSLASHPGVFHSFSDTVVTAQQAVAIKFYIGVTGPITYRKAIELQQVVAAIPLERLLVETDAPFLTPHPHRGQRNEPAYVRFIVEKIAQICNSTFQTVAQCTTVNARRLFHWQVIS